MIAFLPLAPVNPPPPGFWGFGVRGGLMIAVLPLEHVNAAFGLTGPPRVLGFRVFRRRGPGRAHDSIPAS